MVPDLPPSDTFTDEPSAEPALSLRPPPTSRNGEKQDLKTDIAAAQTGDGNEGVPPPAGVEDRSHDSGKHSREKINRFFALSDRIPIQLFSEESFLQKLNNVGTTMAAIASVILTFFVWHYSRQLAERQIELQAKQTEIQSRQLDIQKQQTQREAEQAEAELADLRFKFLSDLTATDENKKTPAEIGLAAHGLNALPVVHYALGVEQADIRKSAVNVVYRLFQAEDETGREKLLNKLMGEFHSPNKTLHTGIVQSFVKLEPLLTPQQRHELVGFLEQTVVPQNACSDQDGGELVFEATKFIGSKRVEAIPFLLSVAHFPICGDGWRQALYSLQLFGGEMSPEERADLRRQIEEVKKDVLDHLDKTVSKEDLIQGAGLAAFSNGNEVGITFEVFKKRVAKAFDALTAQLG